MDRQQFIEFQSRLKDNLASNPSIGGLAFLGSAANLDRMDNWSDHDFFVFAESDVCEDLRTDLIWLPDHDQISISVRETEHGLKVVYQSGHVLEFAIFENDYKPTGVNDYAVFLDRIDLEQKMEEARQKSLPDAPDFNRGYDLFLANLLIGVGRARRGEVLIASQFIKSFCLSQLVNLIAEHFEPEAGTENLLDNQNYFRRFELRYPEFGRELAENLTLEPELCAQSLMKFMFRTFEDSLNPDQISSAEVIKTALNWSS